MPNQPLEESQDQIELERCSPKLKTEWNAYAPISQIPVEILVEIFGAAQKVLNFPAWYQLLSICSYFRNVAFGAPTLWSKPPTASHELTVLMLARSKDAPLDIVIRNYTSLETVVCISNHIERIQNLDIFQVTTTFCRTLDCLLESHRKFSRLAGLCARSIHRDDAVPLLSIPSGQFHNLRVIDLAKVSLDWKMFPIPGLIVLRLFRIRWTHTAPISTHQLLQALGQMPHLKSISLDSVHIALQDISTTSNTADLPQLLRLEISDVTPRLAQYLLSHMSLPLLQEINIHCRSSPDVIESDCGRLIQSIFSVLTHGQFRPLDRLTLHGHDFELRTSARHPSDNSVWVGCLFWNVNALFDNSTIIGDLVHANSICHVLERFKRLDLHYAAPGCTISDFILLWDITVSIEIIEVYDSVFPLFTKALIAPQPSDMLLPKLRRIILVNYHHKFHEGLQPGTLDRFCDALILRRDYGIPVHTISFGACTINQDDLLRLRGIVENVEIL